MPRLFVAIEPPEAIRSQLAELCRGVEGARWTDPRQLHLTLRFVGNTDSTNLLKSALRMIAAACFELRIEGVGAFPQESRKRTRVVWAGVDGGDALPALQQRVELAVQQCGFAPEQRPWRQHMTLARFKRPPRSDLHDWLQAHAKLSLPPFDVRSFHLFASELGRPRARHEILETYELR